MYLVSRHLVYNAHCFFSCWKKVTLLPATKCCFPRQWCDPCWHLSHLGTGSTNLPERSARCSEQDTVPGYLHTVICSQQTHSSRFKGLDSWKVLPSNRSALLWQCYCALQHKHNDLRVRLVQTRRSFQAKVATKHPSNVKPVNSCLSDGLFTVNISNLKLHHHFMFWNEPHTKNLITLLQEQQPCSAWLSLTFLPMCVCINILFIDII